MSRDITARPRGASIEQVSDRRLGIPARVTFDYAPPGRRWSPSAGARHLGEADLSSANIEIVVSEYSPFLQVSERPWNDGNHRGRREGRHLKRWGPGKGMEQYMSISEDMALLRAEVRALDECLAAMDVAIGERMSRIDTLLNKVTILLREDGAAAPVVPLRPV